MRFARGTMNMSNDYSFSAVCIYGYSRFVVIIPPEYSLFYNLKNIYNGNEMDFLKKDPKYNARNKDFYIVLLLILAFQLVLHCLCFMINFTAYVSLNYFYLFTI